MLKIKTIQVLALTLLYHSWLSANEASLDIHWKDKKLSIKAKQVTVCEVLEELAEKTNTKISNENPCDNPITLNIENKSFDEALQKILKHDSYVLVDEDSERKLLVYKRGTGQYGSRSEIPYANVPEETEQPDTEAYDSSSLIDSQSYETYHDPNAIEVSDTADSSAQTIELAPPDLPEPIAYPTDPPFNPDTLLNETGEGVPLSDPNEVFIDHGAVHPE